MEFVVNKQQNRNGTRRNNFYKKWAWKILKC